MKTFSTCMVVSMALALPMVASAQTDTKASDAKYCAALIAKYQGLLANLGSGKHAGMDNDAAGKLAIDKCQSGDTAAGIPVLEGKLKNAKIELPTRG
jgi:hypothetical protein